MVKRTNISYKSFYYTIFAIIVMIGCWESNRTSAAVVNSEIPQQAIRLRILANSDSAVDQLVKKQVRDAIIENMDKWVEDAKTVEDARVITRSHLPQLRQIVGEELVQHGFHYSYQVELGLVPFPDKVYGTKVYPAGDYEAVRVTLGEGLGQNWWCVLFPPLCFVEIASAEAAEKKVSVGKNGAEPPADKGAKTGQGKSAAASSDKSVSAKGKSSSAGSVGSAANAAPASSGSAASQDLSQTTASAVADGQEGVEVRFFLWEMLKKMFA